GLGPLFLFAAIPSRGLYRERGTAAAGTRRVRISNNELGTFKAFRVIDLGAGQVLIAHRVDQQSHTVFLERSIVLGNVFVEGEAVLESGAATAGDKNSQLEVWVTFLVN